MTTKLYVGNLPFSADDASLADVFSQFGDVQEAKVVQDRFTGRSRGFGFVTFATEEDAQKALSMDGKDLGGRSISVSFAQDKPRSDRGGSGGERRFGGGGGGGGRFGRGEGRGGRYRD